MADVPHAESFGYGFEMAKRPIFSDEETIPTGNDPPTGGLRLVAIGPNALTTHKLTPGSKLTIGRSPEANISVDDPALSRLHAELLVVSAEEIWITDLGSANGTSLSGQPLTSKQSVRVRATEPIKAGNSVLTIHDGMESPVAPSPIEVRPPPASLVVRSPAMRRVYEVLDRVAPSEITVLVLGETGVGKEVIAGELHRRSRRRDGPFLPLNCGAFSEDLLESELFGHERGAFTGATKTKVGLLESARGGTVFLDEIGEMPTGLQVKLLRVLEERRVRRVGAIEAIPIDVRFVAATNRDLPEAVASGTFREDLFYRLNGVTLEIPPLRERKEELRELARNFANAALRRDGIQAIAEISDTAFEELERRSWPGNIRELKNAIDRAVALSGSSRIDATHFPPEMQKRATTAASETFRIPTPPDPENATDSLKDQLSAVERERIMKTLEACGGNQTRAAQILGLSRQALIRRLGQYDVPRPRKR